MSNTPTIPNKPSLLPDQNYTYLRQQGLSYLQGMATSLWTDFNEHDPGMTILEALCYVITELGYRTSFPFANLLMQPDGTMLPGQCFFTPKKIMTVNPLTIRDYRKLLVDLQGVQNAWIQSTAVGQEVPFYADCGNNQLTVDHGTVPVPPDHEIHLSGLYKVIVDLNSDPSLGDLNNTNITYRIPQGDLQDDVVSFNFAPFEELDPSVYQSVMNAMTANLSSIVSLTVTRTNNQYHWVGTLTVNTPEPVSIPLVIRIDTVISNQDVTAATSFLKNTLFSNISLVQQIMQQYQQKVNLIADNLINVRGVLLGHRNLCEDFKDIVTVKDQEIAICMDIDVETGSDLNEIQAQIFFQVQSYLSPSVNFYSLKELLAQGLTVDQIFDGPVLSHGFINNTELDQTQLVSVVRTSALVKIIMGIAGVQAVRNVMMTLYDASGDPTLPSQAACVIIPDGCKGLLNMDRSSLTFHVGKIPLQADMSETLDIVNYLEAVQAQNKLYGTEDDLAVPLGTYGNLGDYYSVQNDLPQTYGVGIAGLPSNSPAARVAQARQLKGYLMFFDQLLANFFSQLQGAGSLLSTNATLVQSYFTQYLGPAAPPFYQDGIKDVAAIYMDTDTGQPGTAKVASLLGGQEIGSTDWQRLVESGSTFSTRRNAFLDHLLARFAESFSDYALMMYQVDFALQQTELQSDAALIQSKINFLNQYPSISKNRGKALNYCPLVMDATTGLPSLSAAGIPSVYTGLNLADPPEVGLWSALNISGLQKRVSLLSGLSLPQGMQNNQYVFSPAMGEVLSVNNNGQNPYYYAFVDDTGKARLTSVLQNFTNQTNAQTALSAAAANVANQAYYYAQPESGGSYKIFLTDKNSPGGNLLATDGATYTEESLATAAISSLVQLFTPDNGTIAVPKPTADNPDDYGFAFQDIQGQNALVSVSNTYPGSAAALSAADALAVYISDPYYYYCLYNQGAGTYQVFLTNSFENSTSQSNPLATDGKTYATKAEAQAAINQLVINFPPSYGNLGFYLVEHILLRPRVSATDFGLMEVCLGKDCQFCGEQDPYTFRASVVLPYWPTEFEDLDFRTYFENTIMAEAPAHVSLKICWVNNSSMRQFEVAYRAWLTALSQYTTQPADAGLTDTLRLASNALIEIMQNFHSEYPLAILHDCNESQTDSVVLLGSTILGTYKN